MVELETKEYWEDMEWALDNYQKLMEKFPDEWVAVVKKKVVSSGKNLRNVEDEAKKRTGKRRIPAIFVESGAHVY